MCRRWSCWVFFFFNDTATTEIYTLSLHDALPISKSIIRSVSADGAMSAAPAPWTARDTISTVVESASPAQIGRAQRLNSSHANISYAVFCLKKKKKHYHNLLRLQPQDRNNQPHTS